MSNPLRIGTRKSPLALRQTEIIIEKLKSIHGDFDYEILPIVTKGDRLASSSLQEIGGKGVFIKEVETALFSNQIDFAVHSLKDMPALIPEKLTLACIPKRAVVNDCLIFRENEDLQSLPLHAVIGTSSLRRAYQLLKIRPDLKIVPIRGNVGTRLKKMHTEKMDATVLATAGLERLNWFESATQPYQILAIHECIPAVGQAALAIECRKENHQLIEFLQAIEDSDTRTCVMIERECLTVLGANCRFPFGAYAKKKKNEYTLYGYLADESSRKDVNVQLSSKEKFELGKVCAEKLVSELKKL